MLEVEVSSFHMVEHSSCSSNEDIDSSSELIDLIIDGNSTVDSQDVVFSLIMLQFIEFIGDLK